MCLQSLLQCQSMPILQLSRRPSRLPFCFEVWLFLLRLPPCFDEKQTILFSKWRGRDSSHFVEIIPIKLFHSFKTEFSFKRDNPPSNGVKLGSSWEKPNVNRFTIIFNNMYNKIPIEIKPTETSTKLTFSNAFEVEF